MKIMQLSLFVENKPGHLLAPCRLLADNHVDLRALSVADTQQFGVLRLIVAEPEKAAVLLDRNGFVVKMTEVLAVEVEDRPGGLARVLAAIDGSPLNIEYMYAFPFGHDDRAVLIFRFDDPDVAIARMQAAGINVLSSSQILGG
jgi:hypothetical protein